MKRMLLLLIALIILPSCAFAASWSSIEAAISSGSNFWYEGGTAVLSGKTLVVDGGSVEDVWIDWDPSASENPLANVDTIQFKNVKISTDSSIGVRSWMAGKSVSFDGNTTIQADHIYFSASDSGSLTVHTGAKISATRIYNDANKNSSLTFTNDSEISAELLFLNAVDNAQITAYQNGTLTLSNESNPDFQLLCGDDAALTFTNSGTINGRLNAALGGNGSLTAKNTGRISKSCAIEALEFDPNAKSSCTVNFEHSGTIGKGLSISLMGDHTLQYKNTGSAKEELILEAIGDVTISGTHRPAAGTPETCHLYLYPYRKVTTPQEALTKAEATILTLKQMGMLNSNAPDLVVYYQHTEQDDSESFAPSYYSPCSAEEYPFILGDHTLTYTGESSLTFGIDGPYKFLLGVYVDGKRLPSSAYSAWEGSTYIELNPSYLATLSSGTHTLTAQYPFGTTDTTFEVAVIDEVTASEEIPLPQTGDSSSLALWCMLLSATLTAAFIFCRRKESSQQ